MRAFGGRDASTPGTAAAGGCSRCWLSALLLVMLVASLLVAAPRGAGAVVSEQLGLLGPPRVASAVRAEPVAPFGALEPGAAPVSVVRSYSEGGAHPALAAVVGSGEADAPVLVSGEVDAPVLVSGVVDGAGVVLVYGEVLDEASVPAAADFVVSVSDSETGVVSARSVLAVSVDGVEVMLVLSAAVRARDAVTLGYTPGADPVQDAVGNDAAGVVGLLVTNSTAAAADAALSMLEFSGALLGVGLSPVFEPATTAYLASVDHLVSSVTVTATPRDVRASMVVAPVEADFDAVGGFRVPLGVGSNTVTVTVTAEDGATTDVYTVTVIRSGEADAPVLASGVVDGAGVVLVYGEVLDQASVPAAADFVVSVADSETGVVSARTVLAVSVDGAEVMLVLSAAVRARDAVTLGYTPGADPVQDAVGNDAAGVVGLLVTNSTAAAADAALSMLEFSGALLGVVLSPVFEPATTAYLASVDHLVSSVTVTATPRDVRASMVVAPSDADSVTAGHQVLLGVGSNTVTVTVTAEDATTAVNYTVTVVRSGEAGAPVLASTAVDGTGVVLAYGEVLDQASVPAAGDFVVSVADSETGEMPARTVLAVSVSGAEVTLMLSAAVRAGDAVTLGYTPGVDAIQDAAGNDAAGLAGHLVTNNTAAAADAALSMLEFSGGLSGVGLSPVFEPATTAYLASVDHLVSSVTVAATPRDLRASVTVTPGDADSVTAGHQVPLVAGSNTVTVTVTAEDVATTDAYTVTVTRDEDPGVDPVGVAGVDWQRFSGGVPSHHNANEAKGWLLTTLRYGLNAWWNDYKDFDAQNSDSYLDFVSAGNAGSSMEQRYRDSSSMALALSVALRTGAYDAGVTGASRDVAVARALKLVRSLAYGHRVNASVGDGAGRWGFDWQSGLWAAHAGLAGWLLWEELPAADKSLVKKMIEAEANEYRNPLYYRDRSGAMGFRGDSKSQEQAWNAYVLSLAAVMMPNHPNVDTWRSSSIHLMLSTFARPEDAMYSTVYHGHPLSDWLNGSNIASDGTVVSYSMLHPDYTAAGTVEFNAAPIYTLAGLPTPEAARFNADRVMESLVEVYFMKGSKQYDPQIDESIHDPGGTIFRPGTLCGEEPSPDNDDLSAVACMLSAEKAGQTFVSGLNRGCLRGPPSVDTNVFYPMGSSWSKKRRPNLAAFVAQADVFGFDSRIDDPTLRGDYWFGCFVRDVRAMQARHDDGRTWNNADNFNYFGREGLSAQYAAKSWLAYWIQHQNDSTAITYDNNQYELEFSRITTIEAEDRSNTLSGNASVKVCDRCSREGGVELLGSGETNAVTISGINVREQRTLPSPYHLCKRRRPRNPAYPRRRRAIQRSPIQCSPSRIERQERGQS